jgi:Tol biopolymer transport system component
MPRTLVSAAAVCLLLASRAGAQNVPINVLRVEPLGEGEGKALALQGFHAIGSPHFSKDGEWVTFDGYKEAAQNITSECWVARKDGSQAKKLCRGATPRWSPDGKKLLFMREERADLGRPGGDDVGVFVINADGTGERQITDGRWPDWSPDGKRIAYSVGGLPQGGARPMSHIHVANLDGSDAREVAIGDCPTWSPDGKQIACCYNDPAMSAPMIRLVDVDDPEKQRLLGYGWIRANWSPDGKTLYANGLVGQNAFGQAQTGMVRISLDKRANLEPILTKFFGQSPCPSPDGKSVVFCTIPTQPGPSQ